MDSSVDPSTHPLTDALTDASTAQPLNGALTHPPVDGSLVNKPVVNKPVVNKPVVNKALIANPGASANLELIVEHWPDAAIVVAGDGNIAALNIKAEYILGGSLADFTHLNAHLALCVQTHERQHSAETCPFSLDEQTSCSWHSSSWCGLSGEYIPVDIRKTQLTGHLAGYAIWSFVDSRESEHNHEEFEKFAEFVELTPLPIAEFDAAGQMLFANPVMQNVMVKTGFDDEGSPCVLPENMSELCLSIIKGQFDPKKNYVVTVAGHYWQWFFHHLEAKSTSYSQETSVLAFAMNITAQRKAQEQAVQMQREARRDFYAKMIHELRTPLNAIMGFSQLLIRRTEERLNPREIKHLKAINHAGFQLNELVSDTLDISKIEAGHMDVTPSDFHINDLCSDFLPQMEGLASAKKLKLTYDLNQNIELFSDRQKLRQVIINLLSNAIKYTREGEITLATAEINQKLYLKVTDTGVGIPQEQLDKLFRSYEQIKEQGNEGILGTGLGLALVDELVRLLGGRILVESEYEKGSTFTVVLPLRLDL